MEILFFYFFPLIVNGIIHKKTDYLDDFTPLIFIPALNWFAFIIVFAVWINHKD